MGASSRRVAADAQLSRVHALGMVRDAGSDQERLVNLERDIATIEQVVTDTNAGLVWIDPIGAYLPSKLDAKTDHQVRAVLAPLAKLAERRNVALGLVMHLAKNAERKVLHRVLGSIGFVAAARIVLAVAEDPDDPERRLLLPVKSNICAPAPTLAYRVSQTIVETEAGPCETLRLDWEDQPVLGMQVDEVFRGSKEDAAERVDAESFLRDYLDEGPKKSFDLLKDAEQNGISRNTLFRLKAKLQIRATRVGGVGAQGYWIWSLTVPSPKGLTGGDADLRTLSVIRPTNSPTTTKSTNILSKTLSSEEEPLDRF
jgi:putative DNA primase/helicase